MALHFELVTPEKLLRSEEVAMVVVPGSEGDFGVMEGHAPYMSTLRDGEIAIYRAWPGGDRVYMLERHRKKSVPIDCQPGDRICYGAWEVGNDKVMWGIGPDRDKTCEDCCQICLSKGNANVIIGD